MNFTDGEGELGVFWENGVASFRRVAATLQLADEHFARLWSALELNEEERRRVEALNSPDEKLAWLWLKKYLPLEDQVIAQMLGKDRQQVINLRAVARRRLAKKLAVWRRRS